MKTERNEIKQITVVLEAEKMQLERNAFLLTDLSREIKRVGINGSDSYKCGSELGRIVTRMSRDGSRERDFLYGIGIRILESFGSEEFTKDAKKYFDTLFPVNFVLKKDGINLGE